MKLSHDLQETQLIVDQTPSLEAHRLSRWSNVMLGTTALTNRFAEHQHAHPTGCIVRIALCHTNVVYPVFTLSLDVGYSVSICRGCEANRPILALSRTKILLSPPLLFYKFNIPRMCFKHVINGSSAVTYFPPGASSDKHIPQWTGLEDLAITR